MTIPLRRTAPRFLLAAVVALTAATTAFCDAEPAVPPAVVFDFECGTLDGWEVVEGDLGERGDLISGRERFFNRPHEDYNKQGRYFLTTLEREGNPDDSMTGVVESPVFVLEGDEATLLVGGGGHETTYVALCTADGTEVRHARGIHDEAMQRVVWDVRPWIGEEVFLRVVDRHTGGWGHVTFDDFRAAGRIDQEATAARREAHRREQHQAALAAHREAVETGVAPLRAAVDDLIETFGDGYPRGPAYLERLAAIEHGLAEADADDAGALAALECLAAELDALRQEALTANPLVAGQPILFIVRPQYPYDHHNTETLFQRGEINAAQFRGGAALKTIDFARGGEVRTLLEVPEGIVRDPDLSFDAGRVLFSLRWHRDDDYHIYEMDLAAGEKRQLTFAEYVSDVDPIHLPGGRILFASTREPKYCMCNRHIMANLFTMDGDGANIQQIGHSTLFENHPALLPDGRILYSRWEYVDRNFGDAQGLWTTFPDGTSHVVYYGNNTNSPGAFLDAQPIPGTSKVLAVLSSCHDHPWGALGIIDRRRGLDGRAGILRTWPQEAMDLVEVGDFDTFIQVWPKYEDPYPLSEKYFLAVRQLDRGTRTGLVLLDLFGNEIVLHSEEPGCFDPVPIRPRPEPPVLPSRIDLAQRTGAFYVENVYEGSGMERVAPGTVRSLRVVGSPEKRFWTHPAWDSGTGQQAPGMAWDDFNNKRILGSVPVEEDGSAYFHVPADEFVYFQLLDAEGRMVQSMRSGTIVRPGETQGCAGCHEHRLSGPEPGGPLPMAMLRPPSTIESWYGPPRNFSYRAEVQPVFDRHCVACHDAGEPAGDRLNLADDLGLLFNTSYVELRSKGFVRVVGAGPHEVQPPLSWGSHASRLAEVILEGHGDAQIDRQVQLTQEEIDRVITWIDINAPYYPEYASAYPDNLYGRAPLAPQELARLSELTGMNLAQMQHVGKVNFTRPEFSACLTPLLDADRAAYAEALAIIRTGRQMLMNRPRADMAGFGLVRPEEIEQQARYDALRRLEAAMRAAILAGEQHYDHPQGE